MADSLDFPHERLEWARRRAGYASKASFADAAGVPQVTYRAYENGQNGFAKLAGAFGKKLGVSADWLLDGGKLPGHAPPKRAAEPEADDIPMVGIRHTDATFGLGAAFNEFDDRVAGGEVLDFPKKWVEQLTYSPPELLSWAYARGGSMAPTIGDGDMVLIDHSDKRVVDQDLVWAFTVGETRAIKRLRVKGDRFVILSDSETSPPDEEPINDVYIVGRVIRVVKRT